MEEFFRVAEEVVVETLAGFPEALREEALKVGFILHERPFQGLENDTMGFYPSMEEDLVAEQPGPIFLFLMPIWEVSEGRLDRFREEVERTYLHELGHHLGFDEDDLAARNLD